MPFFKLFDRKRHSQDNSKISSSHTLVINSGYFQDGPWLAPKSLYFRG